MLYSSKKMDYSKLLFASGSSKSPSRENKFIVSIFLLLSRHGIKCKLDERNDESTVLAWKYFFWNLIWITFYWRYWYNWEMKKLHGQRKLLICSHLLKKYLTENFIYMRRIQSNRHTKCHLLCCKHSAKYHYFT